MNLKTLKAYLLAKPHSAEDFPFGPDVAVFKVFGKMFALVGEHDWHGKPTMMLNLKIDPDESFAVREVFSSIAPGYHMSKVHWISVYFDGTVPDGEIMRLIDNSFQLIVSKLPKSKQLLLME